MEFVVMIIIIIIIIIIKQYWTISVKTNNDTYNNLIHKTRSKLHIQRDIESFQYNY